MDLDFRGQRNDFCCLKLHIGADQRSIRKKGAVALSLNVQRISAVEMDCVEVRTCDTQCVLTLYSRSAHLQLALLLARKKECECVKERLHALKAVSDEDIFLNLFKIVLTDNGSEFADEDGLGAIFGENLKNESALRLFYCDPRQSQQKGSCEKNHSELRQILKKGLLIFDELSEADLVVAIPASCFSGFVGLYNPVFFDFARNS